MHLSRRRFIVVAASLASASILIDKAQAEPATASESDPVAQALGYKTNADQVDKSKFAKYQPGQTCSTCQLYMGKAGDGDGACPILGGKLVSAKGWCSAYVKKA
jgi:hypothetical protein